jgi:hypothetical protein
MVACARGAACGPRAGRSIVPTGRTYLCTHSERFALGYYQMSPYGSSEVIQQSGAKAHFLALERERHQIVNNFAVKRVAWLRIVVPSPGLIFSPIIQILAYYRHSKEINQSDSEPFDKLTDFHCRTAGTILHRIHGS